MQTLFKNLLINDLKIVLTFHPLPTLPPQGGGTSYKSPLPRRERARVRGIIYVFTIMRLLIYATTAIYCSLFASQHFFIYIFRDPQLISFFSSESEQLFCTN